jgi:hypothetical protein
MLLLCHYKSKVRELLNDNNTYSLIKYPTTKFQTKNHQLIKMLHEGDMITETKKKQLTTYTAVAPKLYALPKVHKINPEHFHISELKMRPIVSCINSPN